MKRMPIWQKCLVSVIFGLIFSFFSLAFITTEHTMTRQFSGREDFSRLADAISFQAKVLVEAYNVAGAEVMTCEVETVRKFSRVSWTVRMPATKIGILGDESQPFRYGSAESPTQVRQWVIGGILVSPLLLMGFMWFIWHDPSVKEEPAE